MWLPCKKKECEYFCKVQYFIHSVLTRILDLKTIYLKDELQLKCSCCDSIISKALRLQFPRRPFLAANRFVFGHVDLCVQRQTSWALCC